MAETFKVGANARELLRYTQRATRIVTDDISRSDARKIIQKVAALEDVRDIQKVCGSPPIWVWISRAAVPCHINRTVVITDSLKSFSEI